ncbi:MAG: hypothetical protein ACOC2U_02940 [bacterium]
MFNPLKSFKSFKLLMYAYAVTLSSLNMSQTVDFSVLASNFKENKSIEQLVTLNAEDNLSVDKDSINMNISSLYGEVKQEFNTKKIPVLMFHNFHENENRYTISPDNFRNLLSDLHKNDFHSISLEEYVNGDFSDVPVGKKPVLFTFDDASTGQFMLNPDSSISKNSAVGILEEFYNNHDFGHGGAFFISYGNDKKFRLPFMQDDLASHKMKMLVDLGYDLGHHTIVHSNNSNASANDIFKQHTLSDAVFTHLLSEEYSKKIKVRSYAHPFGAKPSNKDVFNYLTDKYELVFDAWGGTSNHPLSTDFEPYAIPRIEITYQTKNLVLNANNLYSVTLRTKQFYAMKYNKFDENENDIKKQPDFDIKDTVPSDNDMRDYFNVKTPLYALKKVSELLSSYTK